MTTEVKETKAQKVERLKRAKNPWEGLDEIRRFAREGFGSIPAEWIGTYFRWWGVYTQGDGTGVVGGNGGEGKALERFMVRIRIPNGILRAQQLRAIADLGKRYARSIADLTVRQNIQLHWVTIEDLPQVLDELWRVGLNTTGACGDVTRNITGCPVAGIDVDEICDASALALAADYEIVPGITSAMGAAAAAGIPLTDRRTSSALILLAGHKVDKNCAVDWKPLAIADATLVIYMPGDDYQAISRKLIESGFAEAMPCAIVSRATTPFQQVYRTTVSRLAKAASFPAPSLLILGETTGAGQRDIAGELSSADFQNILHSTESLGGEELPA